MNRARESIKVVFVHINETSDRRQKAHNKTNTSWTCSLSFFQTLSKNSNVSSKKSLLDVQPWRNLPFSFNFDSRYKPKELRRSSRAEIERNQTLTKALLPWEWHLQYGAELIPHPYFLVPGQLSPCATESGRSNLITQLPSSRPVPSFRFRQPLNLHLWIFIITSNT